MCRFEKVVNEAIAPLYNEIKDLKIHLANEDDERATIKDVRRITKLGTTSIYNKMKENKFPKSFKDGSRTYWMKSDIIEWIQRGGIA